MRLTVAMDSLEKENKILKWTLVSLFLLVIGLSIGTIKASMKEPLIIERGCFSKVVTPTAGVNSKDEISAFIELAVAQRFNSKSTGNVYLSEEQQQARTLELKELSKLNMTQKVFVTSVDLANKKIVVQADRLISAGDVRSAFKWPIEVEIESIERTEANPYGLMLTKVLPLDQGKKQEVQSK